MNTATAPAAADTSSAITASVDQKAFLASMKHLFASSSTFIGELMQNARRAGASTVEITTNPSDASIAFADNGCGVEDFSALVAFARSNWSEQTMREDRPFGMGFFSALFAARTVVIRSRGKSLTISIDDVIAQRAMPLQNDPDAPKIGTVVNLIGVEAGMFATCRGHRFAFAREVARRSAGFPVPVLLDGDVLDRSLALTNEGRRWDTSPVGKVSLPRDESGFLQLDHFLDRCVCFLQGLPITSEFSVMRYPPEQQIVVHLDNKRFSARMPDRTELYDHEACWPAIRDAVRDVIRAALVNEKARCVALEGEGIKQFVNHHWGHCIDFKVPELLNDIDLIPACTLSRADAIHGQNEVNPAPCITAQGDTLYRTPFVTREMVASGAVRLVDGWPSFYDGPDALLLQKALLATNYNEASTTGLHPEHWLHHHVVSLEDLTATAVITGGQRAFDWGTYDDPINGVQVQIAQALTVTLHNGRRGSALSVALANDWVLVPDPGAGVQSDDEMELVCVVVGQLDYSSSPVDVVASFTDEHEHYRDDWREEQVETFLRLLRQARGEPLHQTIRSQLSADPQFASHHCAQLAVVGVAEIAGPHSTWLKARVNAIDPTFAKGVLERLGLAATPEACDAFVNALFDEVADAAKEG